MVILEAISMKVKDSKKVISTVTFFLSSFLIQLTPLCSSQTIYIQTPNVMQTVKQLKAKRDAKILAIWNELYHDVMNKSYVIREIVKKTNASAFVARYVLKNHGCMR